MTEADTQPPSAGRNKPESSDGWPRTYRIVVKGILEPSWSDSLAGMTISPQEADAQDAGTTVLEGPIRDRSELDGVLNSLSNLQFSPDSLARIADSSEATPPDPEPDA